VVEYWKVGESLCVICPATALTSRFMILQIPESIIPRTFDIIGNSFNLANLMVGTSVLVACLR